MYIRQTDSTNTWLKKRLLQGEPTEDGFTVYTDFQTAGRGQQGNGWESEAGANLLFSSVFFLPDLPVQHQFRLSQMVSLAIVESLQDKVSDLSIKWPNDIYWKDKKLAGILIENTISSGLLTQSIVGVGLNVNQTLFQSPAPNPVSLRQITGQVWDRVQLLQTIQASFARLRPLLQQPDRLKALYAQHLYRKNGYFKYIENQCSVAPISIVSAPVSGAFEARIVEVTEAGCLVLENRQGQQFTYHFKEVKFVIPVA